MTIERPRLLAQLIDSKHSDFVKIITGIRRCGKSFLLFELFKRHLLDEGVTKDHIVEIDLEKDENAALTDPIALGKFIRERTPEGRGMFYVLIDEIQRCRKVLPAGVDLSRIHPDDRESAYVTFYDVLNGLRTAPHIDVYVTGSNSKLLSSDVATEFRGRGKVIHATPLSFAEFRASRSVVPDTMAVLREYLTFGGMPESVGIEVPEERQSYLSGLFSTIYIRDLVKRHGLHGDAALNMVTDAIMSMAGSLTNPAGLANFLKSTQGFVCSRDTIAKHLGYLEDAFMIGKARRFDVRGRHYLDSPAKYYASDTGLRNARTGFRQIEFPHLMENVIYNELLRGGYTVDVGVVGLEGRREGRHVRSAHEIDFVVNRGYERIYIQSAWMIPDREKMEQETFSLKHTGDNFKKIVIDGQPSAKYRDEDGICHIGLAEFLLDPRSIETL